MTLSHPNKRQLFVTIFAAVPLLIAMENEEDVLGMTSTGASMHPLK